MNNTLLIVLIRDITELRLVYVHFTNIFVLIKRTYTKVCSFINLIVGVCTRPMNRKSLQHENSQSLLGGQSVFKIITFGRKISLAQNSFSPEGTLCLNLTVTFSPKTG